MRPGKPCSAPKTKVKVLCPGSPRQGHRGSNAPCSHWSGLAPAGQPLTAGSRPVTPRRHRTSRRGCGRTHTGGPRTPRIGAVTAVPRNRERERPTTRPPSQKQRRCAASKAPCPRPGRHRAPSPAADTPLERPSANASAARPAQYRLPRHAGPPPSPPTLSPSPLWLTTKALPPGSPLGLLRTRPSAPRPPTGWRARSTRVSDGADAETAVRTRGR